MDVVSELHRRAARVEAWLAGRAPWAPGGDPRFESYVGHGGGERVIVRGRLLRGPAPTAAQAGETTLAAIRRTVADFATAELADVRVRIRLADAEVETTTDTRGYLEQVLEPGLGRSAGPWVTATVAPVDDQPGTAFEPAGLRVRVSGSRATRAVISDIDDTIIVTDVQQPLRMVGRTLSGSALTRIAVPGAAELYRALAEGAGGADDNPVFYVSSSPWNLHRFLVAFLDHRGFPRGPLLLRDLRGTREQREHRQGKLRHIAEILDLNPGLSFVLVGDSGQHDPETYAEAVRLYPGRIEAVFIREVRRDLADGRVERVSVGWSPDVPFVVAGDCAEMAEQALGLGLLTAAQAARVATAAAVG